MLDGVSYEEAIGKREDEETEMVPAQEIERVTDEEERGELESIEEEEIAAAIGRMKKKKAAGIYRILMETRLYGEKAIKNRLITVLKQV